MLLKGCVFRGNTIGSYQEYGSVVRSESDLDFIDCVFLNNENNILGGYDVNNTDANFSILNSIIWGNSVIYSEWNNINIDMSYSCIGNGFSGTVILAPTHNFAILLII